tara:strand:- start:374 stop:520 length:147 start_codon:yes stop_codon:yes gene_type:complete
MADFPIMGVIVILAMIYVAVFVNAFVGIVLTVAAIAAVFGDEDEGVTF